ncbi:class I SAM-dependent methyltransferase [Streptomyces sp. M19]
MAAAEARAAGDAAVAGTDPAALPALMRLLDETALLAMARVLDRTRLFRDGAPHDAAEAVAALGAVPGTPGSSGAGSRRWPTRAAHPRSGSGPGPHPGRVRSATATWPRPTDRSTPAPAAPWTRRAGAWATRVDDPVLPRRRRPAAAAAAGRRGTARSAVPRGETGTAEGNYRDSAPSRWANHAAAALVARRRVRGGRRAARDRRGRWARAAAGPRGRGRCGRHHRGRAGRPRPGAGRLPVHRRVAVLLPHRPYGLRRAPGLRFALFDIDTDPAAQRLAPGSLDVVLAANVLHNARHIGRTLAALRELLAPTGCWCSSSPASSTTRH